MLRFLPKLLPASVLTLFLAAAGCGGTEPLQEAAPEAPAQPEVSMPEELHEEGEVTASAFDGPCAPYCDDQCVAYARCRQPGLPTGLFTFQDKMAKANSNHAHKTCVAIIETSHQYGHVAYVNNVETAPSPNIIHIHESNWYGSYCSARQGSKAQLNIRAFWCPRGVHTSNCAGPM